jgi:hypothetical protein
MPEVVYVGLIDRYGHRTKPVILTLTLGGADATMVVGAGTLIVTGLADATMVVGAGTLIVTGLADTVTKIVIVFSTTDTLVMDAVAV